MFHDLGDHVFEPLGVPHHEHREGVFELQVQREVVHLHGVDADQFETLDDHVLDVETLVGVLGRPVVLQVAHLLVVGDEVAQCVQLAYALGQGLQVGLLYDFEGSQVIPLGEVLQNALHEVVADVDHALVHLFLDLLDLAGGLIGLDDDDEVDLPPDQHVVETHVLLLEVALVVMFHAVPEAGVVGLVGLVHQVPGLVGVHGQQSQVPLGRLGPQTLQHQLVVGLDTGGGQEVPEVGRGGLELLLEEVGVLLALVVLLDYLVAPVGYEDAGVDFLQGLVLQVIQHAVVYVLILAQKVYLLKNGAQEYAHIGLGVVGRVQLGEVPQGHSLQESSGYQVVIGLEKEILL